MRPKTFSKEHTKEEVNMGVSDPDIENKHQSGLFFMSVTCVLQSQIYFGAAALVLVVPYQR